jgi:hypothetical protein
MHTLTSIVTALGALAGLAAAVINLAAIRRERRKKK